MLGQCTMFKQHWPLSTFACKCDIHRIFSYCFLKITSLFVYKRSFLYYAHKLLFNKLIYFSTGVSRGLTDPHPTSQVGGHLQGMADRQGSLDPRDLPDPQDSLDLQDLFTVILPTLVLRMPLMMMI